jgi:uncharacterized protein
LQNALLPGSPKHTFSADHSFFSKRLVLEFILLTGAAALAGFVDSIVGGGGLILLPTFFATFPSAAPAVLLGTNKGTSVWGTAFASYFYAQRVTLPLRSLLRGALFAFLGSLIGAWCVNQVSADLFKIALPFLLSLVLVYTLYKKNLGQSHSPLFAQKGEAIRICILGALVGFYDGFFGPGTGSFFVFLLVRWLGFDFLNASAGAKILNTASNSAALILFSWQGSVWWHFAVPMACANVLGSWYGTRLSLQRGTAFVRYVFISVVSLLILKTSVDYVLPHL